MSASEVIRLTQDMKTNADLLDAVKDASGSLAKVVQVAAQHGYSFTVQEANEYLESTAGAELDDAQLDAVAGGKHKASVPTVVSTVIAVTVAVAAAEAAAAVEAVAVVSVAVA